MKISELHAYKLYEKLKSCHFRCGSFGCEICGLIEEIEAANRPQSRWICKYCNTVLLAPPNYSSGLGNHYDCSGQERRSIALPLCEFVEFVEKGE